MKRILFLLVSSLLGLSTTAFATHSIGGEISYQQISPNNYLVTFKHYRDCSSIADPLSTVLNVNAPSCNAGRNITLNLIGQKTGRPYGPAIPVSCTTISRPNYQISTYTGILSFSASESACTDWVLSWSECCRATTANLIGQDNFYTEAKLKLTAGVVNSSPAFDTLHAPIMYVTYGNIYNLSMAAIDPDGDSLVYSLVTPLANANTPVTYKPATSATGPAFPNNIVINPNTVPPYSIPFYPQLALLPSNPPATYSANYPMPSFYVNWGGPATIPYPGAPNGGMIWEARYLFELNPVHGEFKFSPSRYVGAISSSGENKYMVSIMVEEFRKINGLMTKLGSVRRETMIEVVTGLTGNPNPLLTVQQANNQTIPSGYEIRLRPGTPLTLNFAGTDIGNNTVALTTNATYILPGSSFVSTSGINPTGTITWVPTAADVRWQPYYFQVQFHSDANPLRGIRYETYAVRVNATGGVTGTSELQLNLAAFSAYPNPFSEELNFKLNLKTKAESILIYNLLGQQVDQISLENSALGEQQINWKNAVKYAAGTYVAKLISENKTVQTLKFTKLQ